MNIVVCVKQVPDTETQIKLAGVDQLDLTSAKRVLNPYDEYAIEEALQVKQKHFTDAKVIVMTLGPDRAQEALRTALAMGCDQAMAVTHEDQPGWVSSWTVGKALATFMKELDPQLVYCGKQGIDHDELVVPYVIAEALQIPCVNVIRKISYDVANKSLEVVRESDAAKREHFTCSMPVVLGFTTGVNKPRYPSRPGIMKAKKHTIETKALTDLLPAEEIQWIKPVSYDLPPERSACKMIDGDVEQQTNECVRIIREELRIL